MKLSFALRVSKFAGETNLLDGIFSIEGMTPIGVGSQEPVVICLPLVIGRSGTVKQKLIKLFEDVREAT